MNIEEIEKNIVKKVIKHYSDFSLVKTVISDYTFIEKPSYGYQTLYFKDDKPIILSNNAKISDEVGLLLNLMFKEGRKTNKGTLTIYPNGEYESSFIWDNEAYLEKLQTDVRNLFSFFGIKSMEIIEDKCSRREISWDFETEVFISFTNNLSNPALFTVANNSEISFSLYLEQLGFYIEELDYAEPLENYAKARQLDNPLILRDTQIYIMMNEGELKGYYPRWNTASFMLKPNQPLSFEDIKFEWREENA